MILAGDVGGTKTLLGLYGIGGARPEPIVVQSFRTIEYPELSRVIAAFAEDPRVRGVNVAAAAFGVAGPVLGRRATLTNVPFAIDADEVAGTFEIPTVLLLNDLQAMAYSLPALRDGELHVLQEGRGQPSGPMALVAAGTGLGEAALYHTPGGLFAAPTEAGHADWAARSDRDIAVLRSLLERSGRASVEDVISGPGLINLHRVTHEGGSCPVVEDDGAPDAAARISVAALERRCRDCVEALEIFVSAFGAEAGNLALRTVATGGVFIGGGIAPKVLPALDDGRFIDAFLDKRPFREMLSAVPVSVITHPEPGLLGAAIAAERAVGGGPA